MQDPGNDNGVNEFLTGFFLAKYDLVVRCARLYLRTPELVADVVQQVYVEWIDHAERWNIDTDLTPILCGLTRNVAREMLRNQYRYSSGRLAEIAEFFLKKAEDQELSANSTLHDQLAALEECLERLPEKNDC